MKQKYREDNKEKLKEQRKKKNEMKLKHFHDWIDEKIQKKQTESSRTIIYATTTNHQ